MFEVVLIKGEIWKKLFEAINDLTQGGSLDCSKNGNSDAQKMNMINELTINDDAQKMNMINEVTMNDDMAMAASDDIGIKMAVSDDLKMAVNSITEEMKINEMEMMPNQLLMLIMSLNKYVVLKSSFCLHENYQQIVLC